MKQALTTTLIRFPVLNCSRTKLRVVYGGSTGQELVTHGQSFPGHGVLQLVIELNAVGLNV